MLCHVLAALVGMRFGWPGLKSSADACMRQECATCNREREREREREAVMRLACSAARHIGDVYPYKKVSCVVLLLVSSRCEVDVPTAT